MSCRACREEAGTDILLHSFAVDVVKQGNAIQGVMVENKSGRQAILAPWVAESRRRNHRPITRRRPKPRDNTNVPCARETMKGLEAESFFKAQPLQRTPTARINL